MSLADEIINGNLIGVKSELARSNDANDIDEYGFTPLIEAAIAYQTEIAIYLLKAGADPNQRDLANRTPLHWACDNENLELSQLLLQNKADPNAYTNAGEPVLAMPLLRNQKKLKKLLYKHGASLAFAKDYINAKLIGHRFELLGHAYIATGDKKFTLVDFEGFFLEFSLVVIKDSLRRFQNNFAARQLQPFFPSIKKTIQALNDASELIKYQHYSVKLHEHEATINQLLDNELVLIPATYQGHAITFIKYKHLFAKCDRGHNSQFEGSVVIYQMQFPDNLTAGLIRQIVFKKQTDDFMHQGINERLGLKKLMELPIGAQVTGNCSWANVEAAIPTMLFLLLMADPKRTDNNVKSCISEALHFYHEWREWDKDRALDECIQNFSNQDEPRNASKAVILASLLFQTCHYTDDAALARAEKILKILHQQQYHPYLESYIKVYYQEKWSEAGENLMHLFDMIQS